MTNRATEPGTPEALVGRRKSRILAGLERRVEPVPASSRPLSAEQVAHLVRDASELYWNELSWEEITDEERVAGGHLTELVFPAFLAFIGGLLLDPTAADGDPPPQPRPEVVEAVLLFLAERQIELTRELEQGADSERVVWARSLTSHLIDLVLYRLYRLTNAEAEALENRD